MRTCVCVLAGTDACKYCKNGYLEKIFDERNFTKSWSSVNRDCFDLKEGCDYMKSVGYDLSDSDKIILKDSSKGDSRTSGDNPSLDEILDATCIHQQDVENTMKYIAHELIDKGRRHDWTKFFRFEEEYGALVSKGVADEEFLASDWWFNHITKERHHVKDYTHLDVNLLDVLEWIVDRVCAEKGRTGSINLTYLDIDPIILVRAYYNTISLLDNITVRED